MAALLAMLPFSAALAQTPNPTLTQETATSLPEVRVIGATPLLGSGVDRDRVPAATNVLTPAEINRTGIPNMLGTLDERVGSVALDDPSGNPFTPNLLYRGFTASALEGTAQGLAVYLNGARFNSPFGDTVNWDFIPDMAIDQVNLEGANPVFGLNALGGSLAIQLKNGFTYQGGELMVSGGSYGRVGGGFQYGRQSGDTATYIAGSLLHDSGWRQYSSSELRKIYGDIGWRSDTAEVHFNVLAAGNTLNGPGTVPVQLLDVSRSAQFTGPNKITNQYALLSLSGSTEVAEATSLQGLLYYSNISTRVLNGNTPNVAPCAEAPEVLCTDNGGAATGRSGAAIPNFLDGGPYAQLNRQGLDSNGYGGSLQLDRRGTLFGLPNRTIAGASLDGGVSMFDANSAVGGIDVARNFIGSGIVIDQQDGSIAPVRVSVNNQYYGLFATNMLDITPALTLNVSGRFNYAQINLNDQNGTALNGNHSYSHFNPGVGLTYRIASWVSAYASWSQANRAPTPAELSCASPTAPCTLTNFFVGDPDLKQVVANTWEAGFRGRFAPFDGATMQWNVGAFRTNSTDDIVFLPSTVPGRDFFQNVGSTLRQGVEAGLTFHMPRLNAWIAYAYTAATFQTGFLEDSPLNPAADANGQILVHAGNQLPGVPRNRLKFGVSYKLTDPWTIGLSGIASSGQVLFGDEANLTPKTGAYVVLNFNTSYQITERIQLFGVVLNALNAKYTTYGTFSDTASIPIAQVPGASDTRSLSPAAPIVGYVGLRFTL
jgi:outer membrane receptor protein involved in Fe transport